MSSDELSDHDTPVNPLLSRDVSMRFGPRWVLRHLNLDVAAGEVHALVGANGSGKSTFVKIVSGSQAPTEIGALSVNGRPITFPATVRDLQRLGLRVVHQDLGLIDELSIAENIALSRHFVPRVVRTIDWRATKRAAEQALSTVGVERSVDTVVASLASWERVGVAFARAFYGGIDQVRLLVLDEVTAALPSEEVRRVMDIIGRVKATGAGALFISHRFEEVFEIADRITVLRDGEMIHRSTPQDITPQELVNLVAGQRIQVVRANPSARSGTPALSLKHVSSARLSDVSFSLSPGEIVGIVGRAGCGRSALGRTIFGLESRTSGSISVGDRNLPRNKPWSALQAGVGYVGQDRRRAGAIYGTSVSTNLTIASLDRLSHRGWLSASKERASARSLIEQCDVRPADHTARMENLSGGNQQKIVLGRWIPRKPNVLVLDEPTEGVDVGARQGIYSIIRALTAQGCGVLVLSSSIEELVQLSDRVLFMAHGEIETEISGSALSVETIEKLLLLAGASAEDGTTPDVSSGRTVQ